MPPLRALPMLDAVQTSGRSPDAPSADAAGAGTALTRRDFVATTTASLLAAALAAACGGGGGDGPSAPAQGPVDTTGATFAGNVLTIPLANTPGLASANGFQIYGQVGGQAANVIVLNLGGGLYRAFSSICTHDNCQVASFAAGRIGCPCHGSQFDTQGRVVQGPATRPLPEYAVTADAAARTLTVRKG